MSQVINWIGLISIIVLVFDVMKYFCKDVINVFNSTEKRTKRVARTRASQPSYEYKEKIAK